MSEKILIVNYGAFGDIINCTPIAKHYKTLDKNNVVKWITRPKYASVLKNNPYIDDVLTIDDSPMPNNNVMITNYMRAILRASFQDYKIIYAAPYACSTYDGTPRSTLLKIIKDESSGIKEWVCDFIPVLKLSMDEEREADTFFASLNGDKKVLLEYENYSNQSPYDETYFNLICEHLNNKKVDLIMTGKELPDYAIAAKNKYNINIVHYSGSFNSNARLYNLCDLFISCCSGITCLTSSDYCDNNKARIEICNGKHWSSAEWTHNSTNKHICYNYDMFTEALKHRT